MEKGSLASLRKPFAFETRSSSLDVREDSFRRSTPNSDANGTTRPPSFHGFVNSIISDALGEKIWTVLFLSESNGIETDGSHWTKRVDVMERFLGSDCGECVSCYENLIVKVSDVD